MPLVTISLLKNVLNTMQKSEIIENVTDAIVSVEGEAMRALTWVMINEVEEENWGIGGHKIIGPAMADSPERQLINQEDQV